MRGGRVMAEMASEELRAFYDRMLPRIHGYFVRRVGDIAVAEDLTQETFLSAVRELRRGRRVEHLDAWVFSIARRRLVDHWRGREREERRMARAAAEVATRPLPSAIGDLAAAETLAALGALPGAQRAALVLHYLDDLPVADVAALLDRSLRATESLLARGRDGFRAAYEGVSADV